MPYVLFLLICAIWGSSFILMKKAAAVFSPVSVGAWRVAGGAAVLGLVWWWQGRPGTLRREDARTLLFVVLVGIVWPFSIQPLLVSRHGSAFIAMTVSFVPLLTMAASVPMLGIRPTRRQLLGVLGALVCMVALMKDGLDRAVPLADLALAGTVPLSYAVTNTSIRRSLSHVPTLALSFYLLGAATAALLPLSLVWPMLPPTSTVDLTVPVASLATLGIVGTGIAQSLFNKLIREQGPLFAGMVTNLVPVGALLWGWGDNERVTPLQVAALVGILAMVVLVQYGAAGPQLAPRDQPVQRM